MGLAGRHFRLWNWIVVTAMLFASLAPALSHAALADGSAQLTEICASTGTKYVKVDAVGEQSAPERQAVSVHADCPSCLFSPLALPPDGRPRAAPAADPQWQPQHVAAPLPRAAATRHPAQPRAPPFSL